MRAHAWVLQTELDLDSLILTNWLVQLYIVYLKLHGFPNWVEFQNLINLTEFKVESEL